MRRPASQWIPDVAIALTVIVTLAAFTLSLTALAELSAAHGVPGWRSWLIPLIVDSTIVGTALAVTALDEGRWFARSLLGLAAALSIAGNVTHVWDLGTVAIVIASVPPVFLIGMTELVLLLIRYRSKARALAGRADVLGILRPGPASVSLTTKFEEQARKRRAAETTGTTQELVTTNGHAPHEEDQ